MHEVCTAQTVYASSNCVLVYEAQHSARSCISNHNQQTVAFPSVLCIITLRSQAGECVLVPIFGQCRRAARNLKLSLIIFRETSERLPIQIVLHK